jgi:mannose-6-phosphate isomerase-like protein (cupin superfamily)
MSSESAKVAPGEVIFVAQGTMHTVKNVGNVLQIGGDTKK